MANFETFWFFADEWINENMVPLIGAKRAGRVYPFCSVARTGAVIVAGSDWPVSTPDPFLAIQVVSMGVLWLLPWLAYGPATAVFGTSLR